MSTTSDLPLIDSLMKVDEILNISADYIATITNTNSEPTNNHNSFFQIIYEIYNNIDSCCK
jgi:hypothetical protein